MAESPAPRARGAFGNLPGLGGFTGFTGNFCPGWCCWLADRS
jgi:hypothetical protein